MRTFTTMCSLQRVRVRILASLLAVGLLAIVPSRVQATDQDPCEGFTDKHRISTFGDVVPPMNRITSAKEVSELFGEHEADIRQILEAKGLESLGKELFGIVGGRSGQALRQTWIGAGYEFDWVISWKSGKAEVLDEVCVDSKPEADEIPAFILEVVTKNQKDCNTAELTTYTLAFNEAWPTLGLMESKSETQHLTPIPPPVCKLAAERSCEAKTLSVDASGSSIDVKVTLGDQVIIPATPRKSSWGVEVPTWEGADDAPGKAITVTAVAENRNNCGEVQHCEKSVTLEPCSKAGR